MYPKPQTLALLLALSACAPASESSLAPSALALSPDRTVVYVAEYDAQALHLVPLNQGATDTVLPLPGSPTGVALSAEGTTAYVSCAGPEVGIAVVDLTSGTLRAPLATGHTPLSPKLMPDGKSLWVANRFSNRVSRLALPSGALICEVSAVREPIAIDLTPDGSLLVIANHLPNEAATEALVSAKVQIVDTNRAQVLSTIALPNGSTSVRGCTISPDGHNAFITHILGRFQYPTSQLDRGWVATNCLSIIDLTQHRLLATVLLDNLDRGAANPWAVTCTDTQIAVSHAGTHEVSIIDRQALFDRLGKLSPEALQALSNDLGFLASLRKRIALPGNGPRALISTGKQWIAGMYFSDELVLFDAQGMSNPAMQRIALGEGSTPSDRRLGEQYFNDAQLCFQQWLSCATCHPDGRSDALNWDLLNDGIGNPKSAKSLLFSHVTPPAMITGIRANAEIAVRAGLKYIQFAMRPESDALKIDAYLKSLDAVPSPYLTQGKLSPAAQQGQLLFQRVGCATCHSGPYYTDLSSYDLGNTTGQDTGKPLDTPTLREVWRTGPWLHDGRAATMIDTLRQHGNTGQLSEQELTQLAAYVLSL